MYNIGSWFRIIFNAWEQHWSQLRLPKQTGVQRPVQKLWLLSTKYIYNKADHGNFNDDHNLGEIEYMLENERKKFKEAKEKFEYDLDNERKLRIEF